MADYDNFKERPELSELDDKTCRNVGCDDQATHTVRFTRPKEYVVYCKLCGEMKRNECAYGKTLLSLK